MVPEEEHLVERGWALAVRNLTGSPQDEVGILEEDISISDGWIAGILGESPRQTR